MKHEWLETVAVPRSGGGNAWRRLAGRIRLAGWCALLWIVHRPWRGLGGVAPERLRWLELAACLFLPVLAFAAARFLVGRGLAQGRLRRRLVYPTLAVSAAAMMSLTVSSRPDGANLLLSALLGWVAGLDAGAAAWPLAMTGQRAE